MQRIISKVLPIVFYSLACLSHASAQNFFEDVFADPPQALMPFFTEDKHPDSRFLSPGLFSYKRPVFELFNESARLMAGTEEGVLYFRRPYEEEKVLSVTPDSGSYWHLHNAMWSPDGSLFLAKQVDDRAVPRITLSHEDPDKLSQKAYSRVGDPLPVHRFYVVNVKSGEQIPIPHRPGFPYIHALQWNANGTDLYLLRSDRLMKELEVFRVDATNGFSETLITERSETYLIGLNLLQGYSENLIESKQFILFEQQNRIVWTSERSGFKQLYLYDSEGRLIRQLTSKQHNGTVAGVRYIDLDGGWVYFLAHSDEDNPYAHQVYRSSILEEKVELLVNSLGTFDVFMSETDSFTVARSMFPDVLQFDKYSASGDFGRVEWKAPDSLFKKYPLHHEFLDAVSADGSTPLEALILKPLDMDPQKKYPVVEYIYGGNFDNVVHRVHLSGLIWEMQNLANEGFVIVFIDGRGTAERGKAFQDYAYGRFGQVEIADHVAVLRQLGEQKPFMDLERVGVFGASWGGHFALRALLDAPELYKVAHIGAAAIDPIDFRIALEPFMGCLPQDCDEAYRKSTLSNRLDELQGELKIVHGTADDDVPHEDILKLIRKLEDHDYKKYEFLSIQGAGHALAFVPEYRESLFRFFKEKLQDR